MKHLYFVFTFLLVIQISWGQRTCGSELDLSAMQKNDPARYHRIMALEQYTQQYIDGAKSLSNGQLHLTIPVVIHVLHNGEAVGNGLNISMAQIQSQIDVLNEDFRRLNSDSNQTPAVFEGLAADVGIEFILACVDPNGNPTNGIVRVETVNNQFIVTDTNNNGVIDPAEEQAAGIKFEPSGSEAWPADRYLNIWVCNLGAGLLGYAQFPDQLALNPETDGVVVRTTSFGRTGNINSPFDEGRTTTHEVGHWLNLRHIWGDDLCGNDFVADTPQQASSYSGCPNHPQTSCSSTDMFMNFMDYTNDACMNLFTDGQANRMLALFNPGGIRESFVDCSLIANICENPFTINGPDIICSSNEETYTIDIPSNVDINWSTSGGINIQTESNASVTITATGNGVLEAKISNSCGDHITIEKEIDSGSPSITAEGYYYNNSPTYSLSPYYSIPNNPVSETPATVTANFSFEGTVSSDAQILSQSDPSITWGVSSGSDELSFYFDFYGSPDPWNPQSQTIVWRVTAESPCGTETYDVAFYSEVDNYNYTYYPNPASSKITIENTSYEKSKQSFNSSSNETKGSIVIYDFNGAVVQKEEYNLNSKSFNLDISKLKPGKYFMKIGAAKEEETHQIVIRR